MPPHSHEEGFRNQAPRAGEYQGPIY